MSTLMLVNPRKRRSSGKRRSAAQVAATRKLVALNRARRTSSHKRRRHNPISVAPVNPRRRRHVAHHVRHVSRRRRHNPISLRHPLGMLMPAVKGAAGALVVNAAVNYIPLPAVMKTGRTAYLTKAAFAILLGTFGRRFLGHNAVQMAEGALTVTAAQAMGDLLSGTGLRLGDADGIAYYSPAEVASAGAMPTPLAQQIEGMGEYQRFEGVDSYQYS